MKTQTIIIIVGAGAGIVFLIIFLLFLNGTKTNQGSVPSQELTPLSRVRIGRQVTTSQLESLPKFKSKESLPNGATQYNYESYNAIRPDVIQTRDGIVVYERIETPAYPEQKGFAKISEYKNKYGEPEKMIMGSRFFGELMVTYIYATKGFALVGNSYTDEVFEVQLFKPIPIETYLQLFGTDIRVTGPIKEDFSRP